MGVGARISIALNGETRRDEVRGHERKGKLGRRETGLGDETYNPPPHRTFLAPSPVNALLLGSSAGASLANEDPGREG